MIEPKQLDELLTIMRKHNAEVLKDGDFLVQLSQLSQHAPLVAQLEPQLPGLNPYATLSDIDAAYGIPQSTKEDDQWNS